VEEAPAVAEEGSGLHRDRVAALLDLVALICCAFGTELVLVSGHCPAGETCLVSGAAGAGLFGVGFAVAAGALVLGSAVRTLGSLGLAIGIGGLAAGARGGDWVALVIGGEFAATGALLLAARRWTIRRWRRREREDRRLWLTGRPGLVVVLDVDDAGRRAGRSRWGTLVLRVDPGDGAERYTVEVDLPFGPAERPRPGQVHAVRIDPGDPRRLVLGPRETATDG